MKCPYPDCKKEGMKPPNIGDIRPYGFCPSCKRKARASVSYDGTKSVVTKYSTSARPRSERELVKDDLKHIRLSKKDKADLKAKRKYITIGIGKNGQETLTIVDFVLQSQYKT